jgi:hypothetical protein
MHPGIAVLEAVPSCSYIDTTPLARLLSQLAFFTTSLNSLDVHERPNSQFFDQ